MNRNLLLGAITSLVTFGLLTSSAFAWSFMVNGSGTCQTNGSFNIVWTIKNDFKPTTLTVIQSSDTTVVPDGTTIDGGQTATFPQTVSGTAGDTFKLTITGRWPKGEEGSVTKTQTGSVVLDGACTQPVTPPVTPPATPAVLGATTQVKAPAGPVNAGSGSFAVDSAAVAGVSGSVALIGLGLRRRVLSKGL